MAGLVIVLGALAVLLFFPLQLRWIWLDGENSLRVKVLGLIPITLLPRKKKPVPASGKRTGLGEKKTPRRDPNFPMDLLQTINDLLPQALYAAGFLLRRLTVTRCWITLSVVGEDAAEVGVAWGRAYALGYSAYGCLSPVVRFREFHFQVLPDFAAERGKGAVELHGAITPAALLAGGAMLALRSLPLLLQGPLVQSGSRKKQRGSQKRKKAGANLSLAGNK